MYVHVTWMKVQLKKKKTWTKARLFKCLILFIYIFICQKFITTVTQNKKALIILNKRKKNYSWK